MEEEKEGQAVNQINIVSSSCESMEADVQEVSNPTKKKRLEGVAIADSKSVMEVETNEDNRELVAILDAGAQYGKASAFYLKYEY